uniref:hypothetical protein n=1 Tax=Prevotella sp. TaxID=59823 RepID=UPI0040294100
MILETGIFCRKSAATTLVFVTNHGQKPLFFVANQRQQAIDLLQISGNNHRFCRKSAATNLIISLS